LATNECFICEQLKTASFSNLIIENDYAIALFGGYYREGHCTVWVKRHIESFSELRPEEYSPVFELITKVSKALEQYYNVKKTYMLCIADLAYHTHFHLIPKHPHLMSMGRYAFRVLDAIEGYKNTPQDEQDRMAGVLSSLIV
jgi:diadenosine tetraphosphate (Ap4A) HIT family hydrolase